jgi:uncharacterized protein (TIGR02646 family)
LIGFKRPDPPQCLQTNADKWRDSWVAKRLVNTAARWRWPDDNCAVKIRDSLSTSHDGHCAFCDDFGAKSEIEHFYSKTGRPTLAFEWTNLFPACHDCNFDKGTQPPTDSILRPDNAAFTFTDFYYVTSQGRIEINPAATKTEQANATELREIYKLNRPELCESRRDQLDHPSKSPKRFRFLPRPEPTGAESFVPSN